MVLVTFIIPTIGRKTLEQSLESLLQLKCNNWKAIILFDGIKNNLECKEKYNTKQFIFQEIKKQGNIDIKNNVGKVRNIVFQIIIEQRIDTEFVGFLDDDDTIHPNFITYLEEEKNKNSLMETCIFRMMYTNGYFLPNKYHTKIKVKQFGISFVIRKQYLEKSRIQFQNHPYEDFLFLKSLEQKKCKIIISPYITYFIRTNYLNCEKELQFNKNLPRILINY